MDRHMAGGLIYLIIIPGHSPIFIMIRKIIKVQQRQYFFYYEDKKGNLWIGTMGGGINLFDINNNTFTRYDPNNSNLPW